MEVLHFLGAMILGALVVLLAQNLLVGEQKASLIKGATMHRSSAVRAATSGAVTELKTADEAMGMLEKADRGDKAMLMVYRPGCPACTYAKPQFAKAAEMARAKGYKFYAYSTQHGATPALVARINNAVPRIFCIKNGEVAVYKGKRIAEAMAAHCD